MRMINFESIEIQWLGHAGFVIRDSSKKSVCIDPFQVKGSSFNPVDVIVSTHEHGDHCSVEDMNKFISSETEVIGIELAKENLSKLDCKAIHYVNPGDTITVQGIEFIIVRAYNLNKFRSPGVPFHPKEDNKIGIIFSMDGYSIYHTGDTDNIPEMQDIHPDVALLPVSGTYVMTASEAIEAAKILNPKLVIPMHFGSIVGDKSMAEEFQKQVDFEVKIPSLEE
jgi:L-ascorbate metabolism protein UlaG (beta-lactamase superfamily)